MCEKESSFHKKVEKKVINIEKIDSFSWNIFSDRIFNKFNLILLLILPVYKIYEPWQFNDGCVRFSYTVFHF